MGRSCFGECYSLTYQDMALSHPRPEQFSFTNTGYLNGQSFYRYDSKSQRAIPLPPWDKIEGMNDWENESQLQKIREDFVLENMQNIMDYYNDGNGSHIFQGRFGCKLCGGDFIKGFWKCQYDGRDFIEFNTTDIPAWIPLDPAADMIKQRWEADPGAVYRAKAYLEEQCVGTLRRYLELGKAYLRQLIPPKVNLSHYSALGGNLTLKCLAYGFYPEEIELHWLQDGKIQKKEVAETQPIGDGTYQAWITAEVPFPEKNTYSCQVVHESLPESLVVAWGEQ
ncbi:zinc-alpha-2-glycoprotein-like isoform X2 [Dromiciops gliroides]|uniref:zinc-alpha-2-glycoprotein-like isoform X2 n=1 Tax=Dromiciops gliroides TaxID=33562 RepID=UPI001CC635E3|nr:zinc-alpha-2-glycoprotein-like isoform X2 [Dromiciops gliroides]